MFGNKNSSNRNMGMNQLPSEELDAATANFDKQFTRTALSSVSGHGKTNIPKVAVFVTNTMKTPSWVLLLMMVLTQLILIYSE